MKRMSLIKKSQIILALACFVSVLVLQYLFLQHRPTQASTAIAAPSSGSESSSVEGELELPPRQFSRANHLLPPAPQYDPRDKSSVPIAVLIASFRDPLCGNTIYEAFKQAAFPDRITIALVDQHTPSDGSCVEAYCKLEPKCRRSQIRVTELDLEHARGVIPARYRQQLLLSGDEEFCMQVDSHMVFFWHWDLLAIDDWLLADNEMAVFSTYPNRVSDRLDQRLSPVRCQTRFSADKQLVVDGASADNIPPPDHPYLIPFFGAGLSFSKCHAHLNVPYDPYLADMFQGEEFNWAARLWTHGYDLYAPRRNYAYHFYDDDVRALKHKVKPRSRHFVLEPGRFAQESLARWRTLFGLSTPTPARALTMQDAHVFGVGTRRSLDDYLSFAGVDLKHGTSTSRCPQLGRLPRTRFEYEDAEFFHSRGGAPCSIRDSDGRCCTLLDLGEHTALAWLTHSNAVANRLLLSDSEWQRGDGDAGEEGSPVVVSISEPTAAEKDKPWPHKCRGPILE